MTSPFAKGGPNSEEAQQMFTWFCQQEGNDQSSPCLVREARKAASGLAPVSDSWTEEEKKDHADKVAQLKVVAQKHKLDAIGQQDALRKMHAGWCALAAHKGGGVCTAWNSINPATSSRKSGRGSPLARANMAEYVKMHAAFCSEDTPENNDKTPCLMHVMKSKDTDAALKKELMVALRASVPENRVAERDEMLRFWCEDTEVDRADSGVCLSWRNRKQLPAKGEARSAADSKRNQRQVPRVKGLTEMQRMAEWYCTSVEETHDTVLCTAWRLKLKTKVEKYDAEARAKDTTLIKQLVTAKKEVLKALLAQKAEVDKKDDNEEESKLLEHELKKARGEQIYDMNLAWCKHMDEVLLNKVEDGTDTEKDAEKMTPACKRFRAHVLKSEL